MVVNPVCLSCDYSSSCHKKVGGKLIKVQDKKLPSCLNRVQDICRDCQLFIDKRCASWKVLNGRTINGGNLIECPKKTKG